MQIKLIVAGAAIALAASVGSASAAEMSTLEGIPAEPMTAAELASVEGKESLAVNAAFAQDSHRGLPPPNGIHPSPNFGSTVQGANWLGEASTRPPAERPDFP